MNRILLFIALLGSCIFLVDFVAIHILRSDIAWTTTLSWYAVGDYGFVMTVGFICFTLAQFACAALLASHGRTLIASVLFFALAGTGALLVTFFSVQPPDAALAERLPHIAGAVMQFLFYPLALFAIAGALRAGRLSSYTRYMAWMTALLFVVMLAVFVLKTGENIPWFGLIEKADILLIVTWMLLFSIAALRSGPALKGDIFKG